MTSICPIQTPPPSTLQFLPEQPQQRYHYHEKNSFLFHTAPLLILGTSATLGSIAVFEGGSTTLIVVGIGLTATTVVVVSILISTIVSSILNTFFLYFIKELLKKTT